MIIADLKGKLSVREHISEDFLTSTVFSIFDLISSKWFSQFLNSSTNIHGESLNIHFSKFKLIFWKSFSDPFGVEPDVIILLDKLLIILEAKFYSGKSGVGTSEDDSFLYDQLAREYMLGNHLVRSKTVLDETFSSFMDFKLLYITKDVSFPTNDIEESIKILKKYNIETKDSSKKIFWTNWQSIYKIFSNAPENELKSYEKKILGQILPFLEKRDLIMFNGFSFLAKYNLDKASYESEPLYYSPIGVNTNYWDSMVFYNQIIFSYRKLFYDILHQYWENPIFFQEVNSTPSSIFFGKRKRYWQNTVFKMNINQDTLIFYNK